MKHENEEPQNAKWTTFMGLRTFMHNYEAWIRSGAPSRERRTRRKAWAQNHGSGLVPDSRVAEGTESQGATSASEFSGQSGVTHVFTFAR